MPNTLKICLLTLAALAMARNAPAVDGVIEINQARALAGGVTSSDEPGFPATLDSPGSYRLTGSLEVADGATTAIDVEANDVTIDLNGFEIACADPCGPGSTGQGINVVVDLADLHLRTVVRNGTVRGMGNNGVNVLIDGVVEDLVVVDNGANGIRAPGSVTVRRCQVHRNSDDGIGVTGNAIIEANVVRDNGGDGITAGFGSLVQRNTVIDNGGDGIACSSHCNVFANTAVRNGEIGLQIDGMARDNTANQNTGFGLSGVNTGYGRNVLINNNSNGDQVDGGIEMDANFCQIDTSCP